MKYTGYIYIIENIINNLKYVGKTDNLRRRWNEEHHKKCSLGMKGKHHTKETCEKIRQALLNRDKDLIYRISLKLKGRKLDKQSIINKTLKRFKPVLQYDLNGNFIKEYKGVKNIIGISDISIINCCNGHTKTANNYPIKECHSRNRKIAQYDINNNLIKIYTSKSEILNTLKMCLCGKNKTSGGFIWKYIIERRELDEKL